MLWALQYFHIPWLCPSFFPSLCSLLLGLRSNWENENIRLFGETWSYSDALVGKTYEGFFEASFQLALLTHIQLQTSWPSMKPLFLWGTLTKAYYFRSAKPGKNNNNFNNCYFRTADLFSHLLGNIHTTEELSVKRQILSIGQKIFFGLNYSLG